MSVNIRQDSDGSVGLQGIDGGTGAFVPVSFQYNVPAINQAIFVADRSYIVKGIRGRNDVVGTGGACTYQFRKALSGTIGTSGVLLHTSTYNLVGTINTNQTMGLTATAADLLMAPGDSIYLHLTGTATSAIGAVTFTLAPV